MGYFVVIRVRNHENGGKVVNLGRNLGGCLGVMASSVVVVSPVWAESQLFLAYPPRQHQTSASQIFFIGSAPPEGTVTINGQGVERSPGGHFAPSFPLRLGENQFTLRYGNQSIGVTITRVSSQPVLSPGSPWVPESLRPNQEMARLPGERVCLEVLAQPNSTVGARLGGERLVLTPQPVQKALPPNAAALVAQNEPTPLVLTQYQGCLEGDRPGSLGVPVFEITTNGTPTVQEGAGTIRILDPEQLQVVEVIVPQGVARTGPGTDYSRLTPLPQGTRAEVTGQEGEWLRLDYGAWIRGSETRVLPGAMPPQSRIRSVRSRPLAGATEIRFPLQVPVPVSVQQGDRTFTLTLHNTIAQTDTIAVDHDPLIQRLDWQQITPNQVAYTFHLKTDQQWGYDLRYEGSTLILSLRHPPQVGEQLQGMRILLDPGHGGEELGARGPNGYPEKSVNLTLSLLLREALERRGATVYLTRDQDVFLGLAERVTIINQLKPDLALSVHYNALPDGGDALNTAGVGMFWYHPQAHDLSVFLHDYLVEKLDRPSYGVFWNNLALTRPHTAPSILLELGFMINPTEFEWIMDSREQRRLADTLAEGIMTWFHSLPLGEGTNTSPQ
ncbi:N-acetylmuramoyl-L-alanine amidase [Spirulina subsalsa FACHB-351]|uniref:N-acetylmuramoyl-L-alanine amidase n=2 Tax=Spirulina subsalsa TaxID=54311 RepID=A0ABT3L6S9_9CYAN|nr:N-acetylmuramoyl-L-alanine amidase [Spirulina subsalsa FACHB-351]